MVRGPDQHSVLPDPFILPCTGLALATMMHASSLRERGSKAKRCGARARGRSKPSEAALCAMVASDKHKRNMCRALRRIGIGLGLLFLAVEADSREIDG